jgi:hypothetical protein
MTSPQIVATYSDRAIECVIRSLSVAWWPDRLIAAQNEKSRRIKANNWNP